MFVILAILLGVIIGLIRKGTVSNLSDSVPKLWFVGAIGLLIQLVLHLLFYTDINSAFLSIVNFISYLMIIASLIFNLKHVWVIIMVAGFTVNFLVIFINGGQMPVSSDVIGGASTALAASITNGTNAVYMLLDQTATRLWFLGDFIRIPGVGAITSLYGAVPSLSFGTFLILIGLGGSVQHAMTASAINRNSAFDDYDAMTESYDYMLPNQDRISDYNSQEEEDDAAFFKMGDTVLNNKTPIDEPIFIDDSEYLEEEAMTDLTEYIPRLTPEMIAEIRRNALEDTEAFAHSTSTETRVFTALRNLDVQNDNKEPENDDLEEIWDPEKIEPENLKEADAAKENWWVDDREEDREDIQEDDQVTMPQWDWNSKSTFHVSDEPVFEENTTEEADVFSVRKDEGYQMEVNEERKKPEWNPLGIERNTYAEPRLTTRNQKNNPYSTLYNRNEKKAQKGRSSDEMRDIWHQASVDYKKRRKVHYNDVEEEPVVQREPVSEVNTEFAAIDSSTLQRQPSQTEIPKYEQARNDIAKKWDQKTTASQLINLTPRNSTERVDSKEVLRKSLTEKDEKKTADAITTMEREKAGYEKVELEIDGRTVSFWRKKKS